MIQRIQSIFLLLVAIAMGLMLAFDIWEKTSVAEGEAVVLNTYFLTHYQLDGATTTPPVNIIEQQASWYVAILASLAAVVALYSIFRYDNRLMQIKLGALNSLLIGGTLIACLVLTINGDEMIANGEKGEYLIGFYLPAVGLILNMLANRFIRKDEALVRSADRFR
jgi:hypothetical protein